MRLIGYLRDDVPTIGVVGEGLVAPLAAIDDFYADVDRALALKPAWDRTQHLDQVRQVPPVPSSAKVLCVGLNYQSHAAEAHMEVPDHPTVFARWASTLIVDGESMPVPPGEPGLDWEVELAAVIGRTTFLADASTALDSVLGYTVFNDVSARVRQLETSQWTLGKNADRTAPIGPVLVTADEIADITNLRLETRVNGQLMQSASTKDMVFSVADIITYITETITLVPGDVIATGTPEGVALGRNPQPYMVDGDVVEVSIDQIGRLRNPVRAHD
jgi:2-keto-4-pentenoate hydratase/2-oxohepta-3-ene-1,7-dioic acid hydratase in catechol pathway